MIQALHKLFPQGTPFSVFLGELRLLVSNVRCVGQVAPEDGNMQLAIKTSIDDKFASLSAQIFTDVDDLLNGTGRTFLPAKNRAFREANWSSMLF